MHKEVLNVFSLVFNQDFEENCTLNKTNFPQWDSLKHIELILALEEAFEVSFNPEDIPQLDSIEKIVEKITELKNTLI